MLVTGGEIDCDGCEAVIPEVYSPATNAGSSLSGASLSLPFYPHMFVLPDGRVLNTSTAEDPVPTRALTCPNANLDDGRCEYPGRRERRHVSSGKIPEDRHVGR